MKLFWKFYSFLFFLIVLNNALVFLNPTSVPSVYYKTTIIFSNWFIIPYLLNMLNALINSIVCVFIFAYAYDIQEIPQASLWLFFARLLSDCTGHAYELKIIQSGFSQGKIFGFLGIASLVLPILPSYLAQYRITFKQKQ